MTWVLVMLFVAAAAEAVWIDRRFECHMPQKFPAVALHLAAGGICCLLVVPLLSSQLLAIGTDLARFGVIMVVAFPALIYALLGGIWCFRLTQGLLPGGPR